MNCPRAIITAEISASCRQCGNYLVSPYKNGIAPFDSREEVSLKRAKAHGSLHRQHVPPTQDIHCVPQHYMSGIIFDPCVC